ncbi:MAG: hypothetical protein ACRD08_14840, partial [Acidimicrobiales bacterium]
MPDTTAVRAFLDDRHLALAAGIAEFAAREIAPLPDPTTDDAARRQARDIVERLGAGGWYGPIVDQD